MDYSNISLGFKLPKSLTSKEFINYFNQFKAENIEARDIIITHNLKLVLKIISSRFYNTPYETEELFSIGIIGLIKAIDTYDITKGKKFSTYSSTCIENEILMHIRKNKNYQNHESLESIIPTSKSDDDELELKDTIKAPNIDYEGKVIEEITERIIKELATKLIESLEGKEKEIVILYFGFNGNKPHTQAEIASIFNISKSYTSRIISKALKKLKSNLTSDNPNLTLLDIIDNYRLNPQTVNILPKEKTMPQESVLAIDIKEILLKIDITKILDFLTEEEMIIISLILQTPNFSINKLSDFLGIDKSKLTQIITKTLTIYKNYINSQIDILLTDSISTNPPITRKRI